MASTPSEMPDPAKPWQGRASTQLLAAATGALPVYSVLIALHLRRDGPLTLDGLIFYSAVIAPVTIAVVLLLLYFLCGESPRRLDRRPGTLWGDLLAALLLSPVIILANVLSHAVLQELLPDAASSTSMRALFVEVAGDAALLALFVGPLVFLGAASEELVRVFLLSRLWKAWPSTAGKATAVVISAALFGLIHIWGGAVHVGWTAIYGLITALYYLRFGRVLPLILAHYLTNSIQVAVVAALAR